MTNTRPRGLRIWYILYWSIWLASSLVRVLASLCYHRLGPGLDPAHGQYVCNRVAISEDGGYLVDGYSGVICRQSLLTKWCKIKLPESVKTPTHRCGEKFLCETVEYMCRRRRTWSLSVHMYWSRHVSVSIKSWLASSLVECSPNGAVIVVDIGSIPAGGNMLS
jgi:hypothetical protein